MIEKVKDIRGSDVNKSSGRWNYQPELSSQLAPYYRWPPNILASVRYMLRSWSLFDVRIYVLGLSVIVWFNFSPELERCKVISADWIAQIWVRHFLVVLIVAGGLHLYFYTFRKQGSSQKYDRRDLAHDSKTFHFNNQIWDNMFWVLTGTVGFLTFYEVLMMWAYANEFASTANFAQSPLWFFLIFFLVPGWTGFHFYWQHRMFHIPSFYRLGHHWHHKNVNVGPWSGAAVHPIENFVWFSAVLVLLLVPSHPMHAIFLMQLQLITAITSHCGFENLLIGKSSKFRLGDFFHQLHHRFCDCNYGTIAAPWDQMFDTYHDGSAEGDEKIKRRRQNHNG
jgi:sterol desaturase/sphingolipid hydroxylase (fatty acid hydroxylase superfamily)